MSIDYNRVIEELESTRCSNCDIGRVINILAKMAGAEYAAKHKPEPESKSKPGPKPKPEPKPKPAVVATGATERWCKDCQKVKPLVEFTKSKTSRGGYTNVCKDCTRLRALKWRKDVKSGKRVVNKHGVKEYGGRDPIDPIDEIEQSTKSLRDPAIEAMLEGKQKLGGR